MPRYAYRGRRGGDAVQGVLEGASAAAVAELLQGQGLSLIHISEPTRPY